MVTKKKNIQAISRIYANGVIVVNIGQEANDGLGDALRLAFDKINQNTTIHDTEIRRIDGDVRGVITSVEKKADQTQVTGIAGSVEALTLQKADRTELQQLSNTVNDKASKSDLATLEQKVDEKASQSEVNGLALAVESKADKTQLEIVKGVANYAAEEVVKKANQQTVTELEDSTQTALARKADKTDLDAAVVQIGEKADKTIKISAGQGIKVTGGTLALDSTIAADIATAAEAQSGAIGKLIDAFALSKSFAMAGGNNGYVKFPNGALIQWVYGAGGSGFIDILWPITFMGVWFATCSANTADGTTNTSHNISTISNGSVKVIRMQSVNGGAVGVNAASTFVLGIGHWK